MKVVRIYHSAVVTAWRERDRQLRHHDVDLRTVAPRRWNEGGRDVLLDVGDDASFVVPSRTAGRHPYVFVYNPVPLLRELRRPGVDVVDAHEEPASLASLEIMMLMALTRSKAKLVYYGAQNLDKRLPVPFRWIERMALRRAAGVHVCNARAGELFVDRGLRGTVCLLGLGVDVERFHPPVGNGPEGPFRFGYVGRLEPHKGVGVVLDALVGMASAELVIVGDGSSAAEVRAHIDRLGLSDRVTVRGFCSPDEVADVYRSFDALVVPSLETPTWVEQFGRVAVEAMASGVPVLASASGALPDVIGSAGLLVAPGSVDAWRSAMTLVATDPERCASMSAAGLVESAQYRWVEIARRQKEFYETVIAS